MAYCVQADLLNQISTDALIQLTDDTGTAIIPVAAIITQAIAVADAEIDSYVLGRYATPLSPVPKLIQSLSINMAIYNLFSRRDIGIPDSRQAAYADAVRMLKDISRGAATLGVTSPAPDEDCGPVANISFSDRIATMDTLTNY